MKILAFADRTPSRSIHDQVAEARPDLIITLGDLYHPDIQELADITSVPKIGVYGNHCSGTYMAPLGIINVHLKTWDFGGLKFGGFQGSVRYKSNPEAIMYTQEEVEAMMSAFPYVDVMLTHAPPYGINDEPDELAHQGFKAFRTYIEQMQPRYWLHGHTYPEKPVTNFGSTQIEYVFREKVFDIT